MIIKSLLFHFLLLSIFFISKSKSQQNEEVSSNTIFDYDDRFACENFYDVSQCSPCQRRLFISPTIANFKSCDYDGTQIINQNLDEARLNDFCGQTCDEGGVKDLIRVIQFDCDNELTKVGLYFYNANITDNNNNNNNNTNNEMTPDLQIGFDAGEILAKAYLALRTRKTYCFKDSSLGYCSLDLYAQTNRYVRAITFNLTIENDLLLLEPIGKIKFNRTIKITDIDPPPTLTKTYELPVPNKIICSESYQKILKVWQEFADETPFRNLIAQYLYDTDFDIFNGFLRYSCGYIGDVLDVGNQRIAKK
ncbi:hypothetical protein G9A89_014042 [Geosiphon pyriformis]|nr:hypothetical protein G9A89_014042 [Geosiphon pyriformis]